MMKKYKEFSQKKPQWPPKKTQKKKWERKKTVCVIITHDYAKRSTASRLTPESLAIVPLGRGGARESKEVKEG